MKHILNFTPKCIQEENDKKIMLEFIEKNSNVYTRDNEVAHMTASSWIVNKTKTKVLMVYHNIYNSWSWTGGHMDGETDYLSVAIKEAKEETGITNLVPLNKGEIYSLEILPVLGHIKRGKYVSCHLHFNVTYLLEASEEDELLVKPDENSGVKWIDICDVLDAVSEEDMKIVYKKLNDRLGEINGY